jgi:hypothetical protein
MSATLAIELSKSMADHEAELAAVAFLARYGGRTLESYRLRPRLVLPGASALACRAAPRR